MCTPKNGIILNYKRGGLRGLSAPRKTSHSRRQSRRQAPFSFKNPLKPAILHDTQNKDFYLYKNCVKNISVLTEQFQYLSLSLDMNVLATLGAAFLLLIAPPFDTLRVMFWNLENFFDTKNSSLSASDEEFSARGTRHWTRKRFQTKCNAIAKGVFWTGSQEGGLPDIIGLAEVENDFVLRRLLQTTALRKLDYSIVHFDSPDPRGIDVALLFRRSRLTLVDAKPCHLLDRESVIMATRDILLCRFRFAHGRDVAILVNHHPSKYGGQDVSEPRRRLAVERLRFLADSLLVVGVRDIVAMGDFNDTPDNPVYSLLEPTLHNLAALLHQKGLGTIKYDGEWEPIDLFFASPELNTSTMKILQIPFLMTRDSGHAGTKPLRTYSGPRYLGGVSDHGPIWLCLFRP